MTHPTISSTTSSPARFFPDHPLGREVAGTQETISAMARDEIAEYHAAHYQPSNVVVAVAGNVDHDAVVAQVEAAQPKTPRDRPARRNGADAGDPVGVGGDGTAAGADARRARQPCAPP